MENQASETPQSSKSKMLPIAIIVAVVVIIAIGAGVFAMNGNKKSSEMMQDQTTIPTQAPNSQTQIPEDAMMKSEYKDGEYNVEGEYTSPGGEEAIDVTVILKGDIIESAEVVAKATRPISVKMQNAFIGGYKDQVIGKKISEVALTKVAGSSLTPKGFNDALEKIKTEAKSS